MVVLNQRLDACVHIGVRVWNYIISIKRYFIGFFKRSEEPQVEGGIFFNWNMLGVSWLFNEWIHHASGVSGETLKAIT